MFGNRQYSFKAARLVFSLGSGTFQAKTLQKYSCFGVPFGNFIRSIVHLFEGRKLESFYKNDKCVQQIWYSEAGDVINEKFYDD